MKVKELIEELKKLPQDMEVTMADFEPVTTVEQVGYDKGVVVISDIESEE